MPEKIDAWDNGYSKYGKQLFWTNAGVPADTGDMLCESCHSLQESVSGAGEPLLLGNWNEAGVTATADDICDGCHGIPSGTHATTGLTVSRTGAVVNTDTSSYADANPTGEAKYLADDIMECMSCHEVHDANTGAGAFILRAGATDASMGTATGDGRAGVNGLTDFTDLCAACHSTYR
jgi:hypothetical protein